MPHRYPCLLVDRVLPAGTCIAEGRLSAIKNITANEPTFWSGHAHFAGFPGVLLKRWRKAPACWPITISGR